MLLIQHGHQGKSKAAPAIAARNAQGIIWSPGDGKSHIFEQSLQEFHDAGATHQAIDPQTFLITLDPCFPKRLTQYDFYKKHAGLLPQDFRAKRVAEIVSDVFDFQLKFPVTEVLSPTVMVDSVNERMAQVAGSLAVESIEQWQDRRVAGDSRRLFVSVTVGRGTLRSDLEVKALLNELTTLDCDGFYLLFDFTSSGNLAEQQASIARSLHITHVLSQIQGYAVWVGYAGVFGYLYSAVGAEAFALGSWGRLQSFAPEHWQKENTGGSGIQVYRAPYEPLPLLLRVDDLATLGRDHTALAREVVHGAGTLAALLRSSLPASVAVDRAMEGEQLYAVMSAMETTVLAAGADPLVRLQVAISQLNRAIALNERIESAGFKFRECIPQLALWRGAAADMMSRLL